MSGDRASLRVAIDEVLGDGFGTRLFGIFDTMEWGEDEIKQAMGRHPEQADRIYHSFKILTPSNGLLQVERTYRSHCRELLDRVAAGEDLRPPTAAELASVMAELSQQAPLRTAAVVVYMRAFRQAFPEQTMLDEHVEAYEHVGGRGADIFERRLRKRLTVCDRKLEEPGSCPGTHWGEAAQDCAYQAVRDAD